jgi:hypothetical protein
MAVAVRPEVAFERDLDYPHQITARSDRVRWLVIPARRSLMVDGTAAPGDQGYADAIGTLYPVAYTLHFALREHGIQAPVGARRAVLTVRPGLTPPIRQRPRQTREMTAPHAASPTRPPRLCQA